MKVLFCYPDILDFPGYPGEYYFGVGSMASVLKKNGFEVTMIHLVKKKGIDNFITDVKKFSPQLIAFSFTSNMLYYVQQCLKLLNNELPHIPVIAGGVHSTLNPQETIMLEGIDMVCVGEGEYPLLDLCNSYEHNTSRLDIENIWFKTNGKVIKNKLRPLLNLDTLPYPSREIFPNYTNLLHEQQRRIPFMASRGCPYSCTYCCNQALNNVYGTGGYVRFKSVDFFISEVKETLSKYTFAQSLIFHDDILPLKMDWFKEFAVKYKKEINLPYTCNLRPNLVKKEVVELLKYANCRAVLIGIESGNEYLRNKVLNRIITEEELGNAFSLLKNAGLKVTSFNMVGVPFETKDTILETIKMNARFGVDLVQSTIFFPYRGTKLFDLCSEQGLIDQNKVVTDYYTDTKLKNKNLKSYEVVAYKRGFNFLVPIYKKLFNCFGEDGTMPKCVDYMLKLKFILFIIYFFRDCFIYFKIRKI
jgi:radical SAM superfamily enzyme YgiQ (UPF0313 family)